MRRRSPPANWPAGWAIRPAEQFEGAKGAAWLPPTGGRSLNSTSWAPPRIAASPAKLDAALRLCTTNVTAWAAARAAPGREEDSSEEGPAPAAVIAQRHKRTKTGVAIHRIRSGIRGN